jgi:uncharacterized damage-inducible protein DinB
MKRIWLPCVAFVLVLTTACARQASVSPSPTRNPVTETIKQFGYYGGWLLAAFDSIPESQYGFRPTPAQQSVGHIAQHLEHANYELCARFSGRARQATSKDSLPESVKASWPKDTLVARLRASLEFCRDAAETLTDANLGDELPAQAGMRQAPRARWVFLFLTDLADHYSQIANYMRLLGMIPPSALPPARSQPASEQASFDPHQIPRSTSAPIRAARLA